VSKRASPRTRDEIRILAATLRGVTRLCLDHAETVPRTRGVEPVVPRRAHDGIDRCDSCRQLRRLQHISLHQRDAVVHGDAHARSLLDVAHAGPDLEAATAQLGHEAPPGLRWWWWSWWWRRLVVTHPERISHARTHSHVEELSACPTAGAFVSEQRGQQHKARHARPAPTTHLTRRAHHQHSRRGVERSGGDALS
jgi:hypothetical protein